MTHRFLLSEESWSDYAERLRTISVLIDLVSSPVNGITLCQGNFTLMTDDLPSVIHHFGEQDKIFLRAFARCERNAVSDLRRPSTTTAKTDMLACIEAYRDIGFDGGACAPDHVPTMEGDSNEHAGYSSLWTVVCHRLYQRVA